MGWDVLGVVDVIGQSFFVLGQSEKIADRVSGDRSLLDLILDLWLLLLLGLVVGIIIDHLVWLRFLLLLRLHLMLFHLGISLMDFVRWLREWLNGRPLRLLVVGSVVGVLGIGGVLNQGASSLVREGNSSWCSWLL